MGCFSSKNRKDKKDKCCTGCFTKKRSRPESPPEPFKPDPNLPSKQKSKSSEPFEPESKPPNSIPVQPPKLLESFPITLAGDHQSIGVFIHPGLAITVSEHLSKPEDCKSANPEAKLNPKKTFVFLPKLRVAIVATDAEGITVKVECRLVKSGEQLQVEGKRVNVSWSNRQRVYYSHEDTENVRPGTPLTINSLVVALHEKPGQGISMNWICTEISQSSASLPQELQSFFAPFKDHTLPFSNITRIYALRRTGLISFNPVFDEFTEHADKLPIGAKICDVPNGPFICGGLENNAASNKAFIYDSRSDAMMAQRTAMTVARSRHAICYANGSVYCVGGATKDAPIQICERYLLRMDKWEPLPPLPVGRVDAGLVTFRGGCFLIGGTTAGNASVLEVLQLQDTAWVSIGTPWPSLTSPVLVDSDPEFIFIFAQDLIRWVPATPPTVIYPKKANIVGCHTARVKNSSVYIFGEENLYEMRVDKDPPAISLKERLRSIRDGVRPYIVGERADGSLIPAILRHEIVTLYDEHGGDEILMDLTKIGYNTLKSWHGLYKRDPLYFLKPRKVKKSHDLSRKKLVSAVLGTTDAADSYADKELMPSSFTVKRADFKNESSTEEIRSTLPADLVAKIDTLKRQMETTGDRSSPGFKGEVAKLALLSGHPRQVAVLLELNEKLVAGWRDAFIQGAAGDEK